MPDDARALANKWDRLARFNAMWAILTSPETLRGAWTTGAFFETGRGEVEVTLAKMAALGISPRRGTALDFGCGMGRVTQALCEHFDRCHGVDVAGQMVRLARSHNRFSDACAYHVNDRADLAIFEDDTFDLVYSRLVLQHIPPTLSRGYVREIVRVTAPGGVVWLQAPSHARTRPSEVAFADGGYRARLEILDAPASVEVGERFSVAVRVRNVGTATWRADSSAAHVIRLGNHWLDEDGSLEQLDDGRASLDRDLAPGDATVLVLSVRAPRSPGIRTLEIDMVHEGVTWFAARGSASASAPVLIDGAPPQRSRERRPGFAMLRRWSRRARTVASSPPPLDMYPLPRKDVVELLRESGVEIVDVAEDDCCGSAWMSYRYCGLKTNRLGAASPGSESRARSGLSPRVQT